MSETLKKKPDFKKLDFSKITTEMPKEITKEKTSIEGAWVFGYSLKDITPEIFKAWIETILPGAEVDEKGNPIWTENLLSTSFERDRVLTKISNNYHRLLGFPPGEKITKKYKN